MNCLYLMRIYQMHHLHLKTLVTQILRYYYCSNFAFIFKYCCYRHSHQTSYLSLHYQLFNIECYPMHLVLFLTSHLHPTDHHQTEIQMIVSNFITMCHLYSNDVHYCHLNYVFHEGVNLFTWHHIQKCYFTNAIQLLLLAHYFFFHSYLQIILQAYGIPNQNQGNSICYLLPYYSMPNNLQIPG